MIQSLVRITELDPIRPLSKAVLEALPPRPLLMPVKRYFPVMRLVVPGSPLLFLGRLYDPRSVDLLIAGSRSPASPAETCLLDLATDPNRMSALSQYVWLQHDALDHEQDPDVLDGLGWEMARWHKRMQHTLDTHIRLYYHQQGDHLLWQGRCNRSGTPVTNIFALHDVPVYRVLWPFYRPTDPLPTDRIPKRICSTPVACVNPLHHYLPEPTVLAANPRTVRGKPDMRTQKMQRWYEDGDGRVRCYNCNEEMSQAVQRRNAILRGRMQAMPGEEVAELPDYLHCPTCYARRVSESGPLGRQVRGVTRLGEPTVYEREFVQNFMREHEWKQADVWDEPDD
jgi:hypothetical protein